MSQTRTTTVPKGISSYKYLVLFNCQAVSAYDVIQRGARVVAVDDFICVGQAILNMDGGSTPSGYYNTYTYVDENTISYSSNSGFCCGMAVLC